MAQSGGGSLARNLKRIREQQGLTQRALAKASGIGASEISRMESGSDPRLSTLLRVARGLQLPLAELVRDIE